MDTGGPPNCALALISLGNPTEKQEWKIPGLWGLKPTLSCRVKLKFVFSYSGPHSLLGHEETSTTSLDQQSIISLLVILNHVLVNDLTQELHGDAGMRKEQRLEESHTKVIFLVDLEIQQISLSPIDINWKWPGRRRNTAIVGLPFLIP